MNRCIMLIFSWPTLFEFTLHTSNRWLSGMSGLARVVGASILSNQTKIPITFQVSVTCDGAIPYMSSKSWVNRLNKRLFCCVIWVLICSTDREHACDVLSVREDHPISVFTCYNAQDWGTKLQKRKVLSTQMKVNFQPPGCEAINNAMYSKCAHSRSMCGSVGKLLR